MFHVAVIGVGGLGSRHLQALANLNTEATVYAVDPSEASLVRARELYVQTNPGRQPPVAFLQGISALPCDLDAVIVATGSMPRRAVVEELLCSKAVRMLVLEKVLFPRIADYAAVASLLRAHGCKAWVNHPRRLNGFYDSLAREFSKETGVEINISGGNWGLGCNTVHFLDLISQLTGGSEGLALDFSGLDNEILHSKRAGYLEFTGTISGHTDRCAHFSITSVAGAPAPIRIAVLGRHAACIISEGNGKAVIARDRQGWMFEEVEILGRYQSELSNLLIEELLEKGSCLLPDYETAMQEHLPFLEGMLNFLNLHREEQTDLCPIT